LEVASLTIGLVEGHPNRIFHTTQRSFQKDVRTVPS